MAGFPKAVCLFALFLFIHSNLVLNMDLARTVFYCFGGTGANACTAFRTFLYILCYLRAYINDVAIPFCLKCDVFSDYSHIITSLKDCFALRFLAEFILVRFFGHGACPERHEILRCAQNDRKRRAPSE